MLFRSRFLFIFFLILKVIWLHLLNTLLRFVPDDLKLGSQIIKLSVNQLLSLKPFFQAYIIFHKIINFLLFLFNSTFQRSTSTSQRSTLHFHIIEKSLRRPRLILECYDLSIFSVQLSLVRCFVIQKMFDLDIGLAYGCLQIEVLLLSFFGFVVQVSLLLNVIVFLLLETL